MAQFLNKFYRIAKQREATFYEKKLYPLQDKVFEIASVYQDKIYLTGGTALARFFFQHRYSEDLDFFTTTDDLKLIANDLIARLGGQGFEIEIDKLDIYFARFYIIEKDLRLKIEFAREFNLYGDLEQTDKGIFINSLEDIGANKLSAFEDRAEMKDILDLYHITQKIDYEALFAIADAKRKPIPYENLLAINTQGISGMALLCNKIDEKKLTTFLKTLIQKTEAEIKKKEHFAKLHLKKIIEKMLWDFPVEDREMTPLSRPVLKRRLQHLPLPEKMALENLLE
jgi:hypothetical protein